MSNLNNKVTAKTLPGFVELLPKEQIAFNNMKEIIQTSYERFGFLPLDTPVIESGEVLLAKAGGETEKQVYMVSNGPSKNNASTHEDTLVLRFDLTVPLAKYVAKNYNELSFPFRRYQIGKVYRGERPQKGRYREFYQCDIDIIGDGDLSIINDAELPSIIYTTFKTLGFDNFTICINNRKILNGLFSFLNLTDLSSDIMRIIDKFEKVGKEAVLEEFKKLGISDDNCNIIFTLIELDGSANDKINLLTNMNVENEVFITGINELIDTVGYIKMFGVPDNYICVDLKIARGLDYYTGTVYETFLNDYRNLGSVCSGGRYDNLAENYTDKKLPGVGISIGLSRLFSQLNELNLINTSKKSISDVLVISTDEDINDCLIVATALRNVGINTEVYMENKKISTKMKYANKLAIVYVLIIGEDERISKKYSLKNMETGQQLTLTLEEIISLIKK